MADNFSNVPFPISGTSLEVKIKYQINSKEKKLLSLPFKFLIVDNKITTADMPTVESVVQELENFLLKRLLPLFGRNVQITSMLIKNSGLTFSIPCYIFGSREVNSLSYDTALFFLLQPYNKPLAYRLYLKGCASSFSQKPLPPEELSLVKDFETLFTSTLLFLNGSLVLKMVRGTDQFISATFRELKKFSPRKKAKKPAARKKTKTKKKKTATTSSG